METKEDDSCLLINHDWGIDEVESHDDFILECDATFSLENCDNLSEEQLDAELAYLEKCFSAVTVH